MTNRLAQESSPYLRQHAHNPVDWYPWGEEALDRARAENKPIFLSIGYSACHWCHVMAHESFEDPQTAAQLNEAFVAVKVDREERPDLDAIYMKAVVRLTGQGGWPMSVWLTPEGQPFYGGTYFPPSPGYGRPAFRQVLSALADMWQTRQAEVRESAAGLAAALAGENDMGTAPAGGAILPPAPTGLETALDTVRQAAAELAAAQDHANGGWGSAPKFPQPMVIDFLLHHHALEGDAASLEAATRALEAMAAGGIYDHLGGGFHRYATDETWTVPHFEKMLYDNAQLARVYLHAFQISGDTEFRRVAEETIDFVLAELTHADGGFFSTLDADSEGHEGRYYVWSRDEVAQQGAGSADDPLDDGESRPAAWPFMEIYGVTARGNFEGKNILRRSGRLDTAVEQASAGRGRPADVAEALAEMRRRLRAARAQRVRPHRDEKILSSWNGLMLGALAEAATVLSRRDYLEAARRNATYLLDTMLRPDGRLSHSRLEGPARLEGFLEDQAFVMDGLLALYRADFDERWFTAARELADQMLLHFAAPQGGFFDTPDDHERLISRPRELQDNAVPCGNSVATTALLHLAALTGERRYREAAEAALASVGELPTRYPVAFGQWLVALELAAGPGVEVAIVGRAGRWDTWALLSAVRSGFHPRRAVACREPGRDSRVPLLAGRELPEPDAPATAWVCRGLSCAAPVTDPATLKHLLED